MPKMAKLQQKLTFADENRLAIFLTLADYPKNKKCSFLFEALKNIHSEKYRAMAVLMMLSDLRKKVAFETKGFVFDKFSIMPANNPKWRLKVIEKISKNKSIDAQEILHKVLNSRFDFSDLESSLEEYKNAFWEIAEHVDFEIIIPQDSQKKIEKIIEKYIELFRKGKLKPEEMKCLSYAEQKKQAIQKIREEFEIYTENLVFQRDEFALVKGFRICECFLALEQEKYLEINSIDMVGKTETFFQPAISFTLTKKLFERTSKSIKKELPVYKEKKKVGYIYWPSTKKEQKIGDIVSRYFMLIKFLLDVGFNNPRSIIEAYEAIKDGRHHQKTRAYREKELGVVKDATEKLNKIGIDPLKIQIENNNIFLK